MKKRYIILLALFAVICFFAWMRFTYPVINDVVTDTTNPIEMVGRPYPTRFSKLQQEAYPEVAPLELATSAAEVYRAALAQMKAMGWEVTKEDESQFRIDAVVTSRLFRFKDDVVLQVFLVPSGSRVDMRSRSRVGKSDLGANAKRIHTFLTELSNKLR